jgi:hypothetical protein
MPNRLAVPTRAGHRLASCCDVGSAAIDVVAREALAGWEMRLGAALGKTGSDRPSHSIHARSSPRALERRFPMAPVVLHSASTGDPQVVELPNGQSVYLDPDVYAGHLARLRSADPDAMTPDELAERGAFLTHERKRQLLIRTGQMDGDPDADMYSERIDNGREAPRWPPAQVGGAFRRECS